MGASMLFIKSIVKKIVINVGIVVKKNNSSRNKKKPEVHCIIKDNFNRKWIWDTYRVWVSIGALHSFSIKNIFCDKMDLRLFYFDVVNFSSGIWKLLGGEMSWFGTYSGNISDFLEWVVCLSLRLELIDKNCIDRPFQIVCHIL